MPITPTNRIGSYIFTLRKFSKPRIRLSDRIRSIVLLDHHAKSQPAQQVTSTQNRRSYQGEQFAYFVPGGVDPEGQVAIDCQCQKTTYNPYTGSTNDGSPFTVKTECPSSNGAECCRSACKPGGFTGDWEIEDAIPCTDECEFGYWDYVCAWENPTPCDPLLHKCKWVSLGVGACAGTTATVVVVGGVEITILSSGNVFKIVSKRFKCGFRVDPAHHNKPWGHTHWWWW